MSVVLILFYIIVFSFLILKWKIFNNAFLSKRIIVSLFILKISAGLTLNYIYSNHYNNRQDSDIFKYFDDSEHIYEALKTNPIHFSQLILGLDNASKDLEPYLNKTKHWNYQSDQYSKLTGTTNSTFSNNRTITKFNAIVRIFSFGNISVHVIFMCFFSLLGSILLFKSYSEFIPTNNKLMLCLVLFLAPSVLLWSSGVLKEGLITFAMGAYIYSLFKLKKNQKWSLKFIVGCGGSLLLLSITKYYIALLFLPLSLVFLISSKGTKTIVLKYVSYLFFILISLFAFESINFDFSVVKLLQNKQNEQVRIAKGGYYYVNFNQNNTQQLVRFNNDLSKKSKPLKSEGNKDSLLLSIIEGIPYEKFSNGVFSKNQLTDSAFFCYFLDSFPKANSYYPIPAIKSNLFTVLLNVPKAIFNVFTKPFFKESNSLLFVACSIENLCVLVFLFYVLFKFRINSNNIEIILFNVVFSMQLFALIGLTCPVIGNLVRFKMPGLMLLLISLSLLMSNPKKKLLNSLSK